MGPVTATAVPSMIPTESLTGSSERAVNAVSTAIAADTIVETAKQPEREPVNLHYDTRLTPLPWTRRIQIPFIAAAVYSVIRTLGPTLRYEVLGWQHAEKVHASGKRIIWAFWHRIILP